MHKKLNSKAQSNIAAAIISLIVLTSSAIFVGNLTTTGSVISDAQFNHTLEKTIQIEVWTDTILQIQQDNKTKIFLTLDNKTALANRSLNVYLNNTLIVTEKTNSKGYIEPNFNPYNVGPGIYPLKISFQGLPSQYLNPSSKQTQIEIQENKTIRILKEQIKIPEKNITLELNQTNQSLLNETINSTNQTIPSDLICENFTEQVLWSSGYSQKPKGSTNYHTWYINHSCEDLNKTECILSNIEITARFLYSNPYETGNEGQGYVQIYELNESSCNNPEKGKYEDYLAYNNIQENEHKWDKYCSKNPNEKCEEKTPQINTYEYGTPCYGIKTYASQYSIVDVVEIKYKLCWNIKNA